MKSLIVIIASFLLSTSVHSQKLEKVYSIVKELRSEEWYKTQSYLWEKETKKDKKNAEAWYYYFAANRALKNVNWKNQDIAKQYFQICDDITKAAYKAVPNSFEANHIIWWHSFSDPEKFSYLERAYNIDPLDPRTYRDMMMHYILKFDDAKATEFAQKIYKVNDMPASAYNWAYNLLAEVEPNAIIFTAGDNDTYLPWIVQKVFGFREDVTIMNTSLLGLDDYRNELFEKTGIRPFNQSLGGVLAYEQSVKIQKEMFEHVFSHDGTFPVYVAATAQHQFTENFDSLLYPTGLTFKYCTHTIDNIAYIKRNYEKRYQLDYLNQSFSFHPLNQKTNDFNVYYLQSFVKLYWHYRDCEEFVKSEKLKKQITDIATKGKQEGFLKQLTDELNKQVK